MSRAAHLAARLYRRATSSVVQREGLLEDAFAATLEHPEVWPRLRRLAGWSELPEGPPESVATQEPVPGGRTDILLGNDKRDLLVPGVPDLRLMIHLNPKHATSAALRGDPAFVAAATTWARSGGGVTRQYDPDGWPLHDARESLVVLAPAEDQALAFQAWMQARATEMIDAGIVDRLAAVPR